MSLSSVVRCLALAAAVSVLAGCASGVVRMDSQVAAANAAAMKVTDVKTVSLWLNDDAKKLVADNMKFNADALKSTVERSLAARGLMKSDAAHSLDIEVSSIRTRSAFSAVMFGFMAGNDHIEGVVSVKDANGNVVKRSKVSASYALGGLAGGQDDARMSWLYEEFSKHTVAEVSGMPVK